MKGKPEETVVEDALLEVVDEIEVFTVVEEAMDEEASNEALTEVANEVGVVILVEATIEEAEDELATSTKLETVLVIKVDATAVRVVVGPAELVVDCLIDCFCVAACAAQ